MACNVFRQYIFLVVILFGFTKVYAQDYFTAALFAHARRGNLTSDPAEKIIADNLDMYAKAATVAKQNNADLIGYPEYGLYTASERKDLEPYMEDVPDPKASVNPCMDVASTPILKTLSCIARNNSINVIANMGDAKNCEGDPQCPEDGKFYYNTDVVFDRNGTLVYRYHEEHLWFEPGMNQPTEKQDYTFTIDVGQIGNCIGFDMVFSRIGPDAIPDSVVAVVNPTIGLTSPPFQMATPSWQSWGITNNVTLLAVNLQVPGLQSVGSGVYVRREGAVASTDTADGISRLIISKVPKKNKSVSPDAVIYTINETNVEIWNTADEHIPDRCDINLLGKPADVYTDYRCTSQDVSNYNLVKLNDTAGHIVACNNGMCCELDYTANSMGETFYFGVYNGTYKIKQYQWEVENCFLARCDDVDGKPCAEFLMGSNTVFSKVDMTATFSTKYAYPIFAANQVRLVPVADWTYDWNGNQASIHYDKASGVKLLVAGLKGRPYNRDPPYTTEN